MRLWLFILSLCACVLPVSAADYTITITTTPAQDAYLASQAVPPDRMLTQMLQELLKDRVRDRTIAEAAPAQRLFLQLSPEAQKAIIDQVNTQAVKEGVTK